MGIQAYCECGKEIIFDVSKNVYKCECCGKEYKYAIAE